MFGIHITKNRIQQVWYTEDLYTRCSRCGIDRIYTLYRVVLLYLNIFCIIVTHKYLALYCLSELLHYLRLLHSITYHYCQSLFGIIVTYKYLALYSLSELLLYLRLLPIITYHYCLSLFGIIVTSFFTYQYSLALFGIINRYHRSLPSIIRYHCYLSLGTVQLPVCLDLPLVYLHQVLGRKGAFLLRSLKLATRTNNLFIQSNQQLEFCTQEDNSYRAYTNHAAIVDHKFIQMFDRETSISLSCRKFQKQIR